MLAPGVVIPFDGNHADIPSGFSRVTALDSKMHKGAGTANPSDTGGSDTHTHTSPSHSHTMVNHTHTYFLPQYSGGTEDSGDGASGDRESDEVHTHSGTSGAVSGGTLSSAATIGSANSIPPYYSVIFIQADSYKPIPANALVYRNDTTQPPGFYFCDGNNSTPNLVDKYLRGAATSGNAGSTGGSLTHTHSYDHGHSAASHTHSGAASGTATNGQGGSTTSPGNAAYAGHRHTVYLNSTSTSCNSATGTFTSGTVEPSYKTLRINKNTSGVTKMPSKGDIAMWLGTVASIPIGWHLCDGNNGTPDLQNYFIKISSTPGSTGGNNTHLHSGVASHTHTATGTHVHTGYTSGPDSSRLSGVGEHSHANTSHTHSVTSVSSVTATWNTSTIDGETSDNQPAHVVVAYIQFGFPPFGGANFFFSKL